MTSNIAAILNLIRYTGILSHLLPLVFFLLFKIHSREKSLRVIFYYILYCILNESVGYYLHLIHIENAYFLYAIFTVAEFSFFCLFYHCIIPSGVVKKLLVPLCFLFFVFSAIDFFLVNKMNDFDSIAIGVESIIIILLCIYYLIVQIKESNNLLIYSTFNFWIIITFFIYLSGTFFLYIMTETMIYNKAFRIQYLVINSFFNILKNVLLSIAMVMKSSQVAPELKKNYERNDYNPVN